MTLFNRLESSKEEQPEVDASFANEPGRSLSRDLNRTERREEEEWQKIERREKADRQRALAFAWIQYHQQRLVSQKRTSALLEAHHKSEIARYQEILGLHVYGNG